MSAKLGTLDDESRAHAEMAEQRRIHRERHDRLRELAAGQKVESARRVVDAALTGQPTALAELEAQGSRAGHPIAGDVGRIRADQDALVATVAEMLRRHDERQAQRG